MDLRGIRAATSCRSRARVTTRSGVHAAEGTSTENASSPCRCCHRGGIHTADKFVRLEVDEEGRDVWSYADGVTVVVF
jgi:hypothetical protein